MLENNSLAFHFSSSFILLLSIPLLSVSFVLSDSGISLLCPAIYNSPVFVINALLNVEQSTKTTEFDNFVDGLSKEKSGEYSLNNGDSFSVFRFNCVFLLLYVSFHL